VALLIHLANHVAAAVGARSSNSSPRRHRQPRTWCPVLDGAAARALGARRIGACATPAAMSSTAAQHPAHADQWTPTGIAPARRYRASRGKPSSLEREADHAGA